MKKRWIFLKLVLGLLILGFILFKFNFREVLFALGQLPLSYALLTIAIYVLINFSGCLKVALLLQPLGHRIPLKLLFKEYSLSFSYGQFVPGKIGEFSLVYFLKKHGVPLGVSGPIVLIDKLAGFLILTIFALIGMRLYLPNYFYGVLLLFILGSALLYFLLFTDGGRTFAKKMIWKKISNPFSGFSTTLVVIKKEKARLGVALLLSLMKWMLSGWILWHIFQFFSVPVNYLQVMFVTSIASMISFIPLTFNGIGLKEGSAIAVFRLIGLPDSVVLVAFLYVLIYAYVLSLFHIVISFLEGK